MESTYKKMVHNALLEDIAGFTQKFVYVMKHKLDERINDIREEISSDLLDYTPTIEEAIRSGSKSFTFRSTSDAREFSKGLMEAGITKKTIMTRGKTVSINAIPDRDMEEMVVSMAKDMKAKITEDMNILLIMKECISEDQKLPLILSDDTFVILESRDCESIITLHDTLNSTNQEKLRTNLLENESSFKRILDFAVENTTEEEG